MKRFKTFLIGFVVVAGLLAGGAEAVYLFVLRPVISIEGQVSKVIIYEGGTDIIASQSSTAQHFRVSPGTYTVEVTAPNGGVIAKNYNLGLRDNQTFTAPTNPTPPDTSDLVTNAAALEPTIENNTLYYLDAAAGVFTSTSTDGLTTPLLPTADEAGTNQVTQISPLPNNHELFVTADGNPYFRDSTDAEPLSMTGIDTSNLNQEQILFGSNPRNGDFVMSVNQTIYHYDSVDSDPVKIATLQTRFNRLVYGGNRFLAFDTTMPYSSTDLKPAYAKKYLVYPVLADVQSKKSFQLGDVLVDASISPDGKQLVAKYRQQADSKLYSINNASLQTSLVASPPRPTTLSPVWNSNTTFLYASGNNLWQYDITTDSSSALAIDLQTPPASIALQKDGSVIYTTLDSKGNGNAYKISQKPSLDTSTTKKLASFLTNSLANNPAVNTVVYINITKPVFQLNLVYPPGGINPTDADAVNTFKQQLTADGIDPSSFTIQATY